jgi:hypothetical protein
MGVRKDASFGGKGLQGGEGEREGERRVNVPVIDKLVVRRHPEDHV